MTPADTTPGPWATWALWLLFTLAMAVAQVIVNELVAPAVREWRERRKAVAPPARPHRTADWPVVLGCLAMVIGVAVVWAIWFGLFAVVAVAR